MFNGFIYNACVNFIYDHSFIFVSFNFIYINRVLKRGFLVNVHFQVYVKVYVCFMEWHYLMVCTLQLVLNNKHIKILRNIRSSRFHHQSHLHSDTSPFRCTLLFLDWINTFLTNIWISTELLCSEPVKFKDIFRNRKQPF